MSTTLHREEVFTSPTAIFQGPASMESKHPGLRWVLVHTGNDIAYGLVYVAGDLLRRDHKILWIDGEDDVEKNVKKISLDNIRWDSQSKIPKNLTELGFDHDVVKNQVEQQKYNNILGENWKYISWQ